MRVTADLASYLIPRSQLMLNQTPTEKTPQRQCPDIISLSRSIASRELLSPQALRAASP